VSARALCPCCAATWTWLDGPACPHCGWNARDASAGMGAARAGVEENLEKAGWTDSAWRRNRKTWLETGDLSALTAMDACDPAGMSGDDWLDCDEYDAKRAPVPELPPPSPGYHRISVGALAAVVLLAWGAMLAVLSVLWVIWS
jgi:hypothetical protein